VKNKRTKQKNRKQKFMITHEKNPPKKTITHENPRSVYPPPLGLLVLPTLSTEDNCGIVLRET
jgi:hypothetical protein